MPLLVRAASVLVVAALGLACSSDKAGPEEIGAQLFSVGKQASPDSASIFGVWEGTASATLTAAVDRIELRPSGVTYARRCKAQTGEPWVVGARVDATVSNGSIEHANRLSGGALSAENVPCNIHLDAGVIAPCVGGVSSSAARCFVLSSGSFQFRTSSAGEGAIISFAKVSD
jgi:hypothetical protein